DRLGHHRPRCATTDRPECGSVRRKAALQAFDITLDGRLWSATCGRRYRRRPRPGRACSPGWVLTPWSWASTATCDPPCFLVDLSHVSLDSVERSTTHASQETGCG